MSTNDYLAEVFVPGEKRRVLSRHQGPPHVGTSNDSLETPASLSMLDPSLSSANNKLCNYAITHNRCSIRSIILQYNSSVRISKDLPDNN